MEWIGRMKCKKALFTIAFIHLLIAALLSVVSFWLCINFRAQMSPHMVKIQINEGVFEAAESEIAALSSREVIVGEALSVLQILLPIVFFVIAMLSTASVFYRLKLEKPLDILTKSAARIMENDLDFTIEGGADDELGQLCAAFEIMRQSLLKNNRHLWLQTEERKRLNAAFSHDLRNPLTVLKGSVKMAKQCCKDRHCVQYGDAEATPVTEMGGKDGIQAKCAVPGMPTERDAMEKETMEAAPEKAVPETGTPEAATPEKGFPETGTPETAVPEKEVPETGTPEAATPEKEFPETDTIEKGTMEKDAMATEFLMENLLRIESYTDRIERYVEIMSKVGKLEEIVAVKAPVDLEGLAGELEDAMEIVASDSGKQLDFCFARTDTCQKGVCILLDKNILFQIAENLVTNAARFARHQISVKLSLSGKEFTFEAADDGTGFPAELLKNGVRPFYKSSADSGHFGMGLYICELLCRKHGGSLAMWNLPTGAMVRVVFDCSSPARE